MYKRMMFTVVCALMLGTAVQAEWKPVSSTTEMVWKLPGQSQWQTRPLPRVTAAPGQQISIAVKVTCEWVNIIGGRSAGKERRPVRHATVRWLGGKGITAQNRNNLLFLDVETTDRNGVATFTYAVPSDAIRGVRSTHSVQLLNWTTPKGVGCRGGATPEALFAIQ